MRILDQTIAPTDIRTPENDAREIAKAQDRADFRGVTIELWHEKTAADTRYYTYAPEHSAPHMKPPQNSSKWQHVATMTPTA